MIVKHRFALFLLGLTFALLTAIPVQAESLQELFLAANQSYKSGEFSKAVELYEKLVATQGGFSVVYYNLGNSYFKQKKLGWAVLNYERARRLRPRDREILGNLDFVRTLIEYKIEDKRNWYWVQLRGFLEHFRFREFLVLGLVFYLLFMVSYLMSILTRKNFGLSRMTGVLLFLTALALFLTLAKGAIEKYESEGIVIQQELEVRYGPSQQDKIAFRLVEGLKARVVEDRTDWVRIELVSGETGWCAKSGVEVI